MINLILERKERKYRSDAKSKFLWSTYEMFQKFSREHFHKYRYDLQIDRAEALKIRFVLDLKRTPFFHPITRRTRYYSRENKGGGKATFSDIARSFIQRSKSRGEGSNRGERSRFNATRNRTIAKSCSFFATLSVFSTLSLSLESLHRQRNERRKPDSAASSFVSSWTSGAKRWNDTIRDGIKRERERKKGNRVLWGWKAREVLSFRDRLPPFSWVNVCTR